LFVEVRHEDLRSASEKGQVVTCGSPLPSRAQDEITVLVRGRLVCHGRYYKGF
jgi:hypothetical protein